MRTLFFIPGWKRIDQAALGLIYGAILVLSMLMALQEAHTKPHRPAIVLFGSVLAVTLAKAFSEVLAHAVQTRERILRRRPWATAWQHAQATLAVAIVPTILLVGAARGWMAFALAVAVSQGYCVAVLVVVGARVGWAIHPNSWLPVGGAAFAGGIGSALAALKYALH